MYRNGHPASMLARHVTTIAKLDGESKHVAIAKSMWGPILWTFFHGMGSLLAKIETPDARNSFTQQMWVMTKELLETLPCPFCRSHALDEYKAKKSMDNASTPETRNSYQVFFFEFHNRVNTRLHKKVISYEVMIDTTRDINVMSKIQEYYRSINGYRIWKRRDDFMAKFNTLYHGIHDTLQREAIPSVVIPSTADSESSLIAPST